MTTTAQTEDALIHALTTIRTMWPVLHGSQGAGSIAAKPPAKVLYSHEITSERTDDLPRIDVVIDLKADAAGVLNGWARILMEEHDLSHALPSGHDVPGLCTLLERWARWYSGHEAVDAMLDELQTLARKMSWTAFPNRPNTITIGACPSCTATVKSKPGAATIRCRQCGCEGDVQEWIDALEDGLRPVTLPNLATLLHRRMHLRVTERTLRNWVKDGIFGPLEAFGPQTQYPRYDPVLAMRQISLMYRACAMCGRPWQGVDQVCYSCQPLLDRAPRKVGPVLATVSTLRGPAPVQHWPRRHEESDVCRMSDLPAVWCAHCLAQTASG